MLREHTIQFLECTIIFLLLTNAVSVAAAAYAITVASGRNAREREAKVLATTKANAVLTAMWPRSGR